MGRKNKRKLKENTSVGYILAQYTVNKHTLMIEMYNHDRIVFVFFCRSAYGYILMKMWETEPNRE